VGNLTQQQVDEDVAELDAGIGPHWLPIPEYMRDGLRRWILYGIPPGDFLCAVLQNDLREACARADDTNRHLLFNYMAFLYNHAPQGSWGGPISFQSWSKIGGLKKYQPLAESHDA
jgi:hypothetical protein